jgi:hypothetical protein
MDVPEISFRVQDTPFLKRCSNPGDNRQIFIPHKYNSNCENRSTLSTGHRRWTVLAGDGLHRRAYKVNSVLDIPDLSKRAAQSGPTPRSVFQDNHDFFRYGVRRVNLFRNAVQRLIIRTQPTGGSGVDVVQLEALHEPPPPQE